MLAAALRYMLVALLGSLLYLIGTVLLYSAHGVLDLRLVAGRTSAPADLLAVALMTAGLAAKMALFPFHAWLPPAHSGAPAPASAMLSALVPKAAFVILIRLWFEAVPDLASTGILMLLGGVGAAAIMHGGLMALRQDRLKLVIAYSTVAQIGYLLLIFPLAGGESAAQPWAAGAWNGAVFHALSHGLAKAAMFLCAGVWMVSLGHDRRGAARTGAGHADGSFRLRASRHHAHGIATFGRVRRQIPVADLGDRLGPMGVGGRPAGRWPLDRRLSLSTARRPLGEGGRDPCARAPLTAGGAPCAGRRGNRAWHRIGRAVRVPADRPPRDGSGGSGMSALLPVLILITSLVPAALTFFVPDDRHHLRNALNLGGAVLKLGLVAFMLLEVAGGAVYESRLEFVPGLFLLLRVDALALLFLSLSAVLWFLTTIYAIAYFKAKPELSRFFGFFSLCVAATTGIALSGTLITFFIFFELLTLSTWPLVVHKRDGNSMSAGRAYLLYAMPASAVLLVAIVWLESAVGPVEFGGSTDLSALDDTSLRVIFALFIVGLGAKAALIPLHGWLPQAMAAPAPVSALLHAVAVVKAGAFGIMRVVFDVSGLDRVAALGVATPLAILAAATIIWGSVQALRQEEIKKRLAYSTVSQVSYIMLGIALGGPYAAIGGLAHLVHQGLMKITLFFCAGIFDNCAGVTRIDALDGLGGGCRGR